VRPLKGKKILTLIFLTHFLTLKCFNTRIVIMKKIKRVKFSKQKCVKNITVNKYKKYFVKIFSVKNTNDIVLKHFVLKQFSVKKV